MSGRARISLEISDRWRSDLFSILVDEIYSDRVFSSFCCQSLNPQLNEYLSTGRIATTRTFSNADAEQIVRLVRIGFDGVCQKHRDDVHFSRFLS